MLPNIEPGYAGRSSLGVHMFTRHAVWKDVIHTSSQLLMEIPDELGQYLGDYEKKTALESAVYFFISFFALAAGAMYPEHTR